MFVIIFLCVISLVIGFLLGILCGWKKAIGFSLTWKTMSYKHLLLFETCIKWIKIKQNKKSIVKYLQGMQCSKIGIYGMGLLGERLFYELKNKGMTIYGIDKNANNINIQGIDIILPEKINSDIDIIIVTPIMFFETIQKNLFDILGSDVRIISLAAILCDLDD